MSGARDSQDIELVVFQPSNTKAQDSQEVLLVIVPVTTISPGAAQQQPQVCVIC
jgi:hypothetical protein